MTSFQDQDKFDERMYAVKQLCVNGKVPPKVHFTHTRCIAWRVCVGNPRCIFG